MAQSNPKNANESKPLKAREVILTEDSYKSNIYFVVNDEGYYEKAIGNFNDSKTYYDIGVFEDGLDANVIFTPYTFKGFNPPGYEEEESPTGVTLKDFTISTYAGSYTHDTYKYRMARMLNECEDHLVMDSVVFHYLFIERHTMVDNVAKNTFWSTEDLVHWDLTKDYDNDTSDGIDNSGILSFSYGIECLDKDQFGGNIFNASSSVWINFLYGLPTARAELYKKLE
jgi:hypothetical protein